MKIVVVGLSITSSWGNGHATTYRSLLGALAARGHDLLFLERNTKWYAENRDLPYPPYCEVGLYQNLHRLKTQYARRIRAADMVMVGSYVTEGVPAADWLIRTATGPVVFYDIDTPVTIEKIAKGDYEYLSPELIPHFDLYLSFAGGPLLEQIRSLYGARVVRPLYCSADSKSLSPQVLPRHWDLGYLGTYSRDRHRLFESFMLIPATMSARRSFAVVGSQYPSQIVWPPNVERLAHLAPQEHRFFYNSQRFTLNLTRAPMVKAGYSPSVRLFEAAACGAAIITDRWNGLELFFQPGEEILVADSSSEVISIICNMSETRRSTVGKAAYQRFLQEHTSEHRAQDLERYLQELEQGVVA
jgi:spore maturation protein CgeB